MFCAQETDEAHSLQQLMDTVVETIPDFSTYNCAKKKTDEGVARVHVCG